MPRTCYARLKYFMEAGKERPKRDMPRDATRTEIREMKRENAGLRTQVAELSPDNAILRKVAEGNF
jgi:hypothetical protein